MIATPNLDRIAEVKEESQQIGEFIEWMQLNGLWICKMVEYTEDGRELIDPYFVPHYQSIPSLLADYYDINEEAAEEEREAILNSYREKVYGTA